MRLLVHTCRQDNLVVLSPEGEEQLKLPLTELVKRSKFQHLLHTVSAYSVYDPLHTNTVAVITEGSLPAFPMADRDRY